MGYYTDFLGTFSIHPPLKKEHKEYLSAFFYTRRMKRNSNIVAKLPDPIRRAAGLSPGEEGEYYTGDQTHFGQDIGREDMSVIDHNIAPKTQPGLWCSMGLNNDTELFLEDGKNYSYVEWLRYVIKNFFIPWGYKLNGCVSWQGEESNDTGNILIIDNEITVSS